MENIVIILVLAMIVGGIVFYLARSKRKGKKCIGCPYAEQCGGRNCTHSIDSRG